MTALQDISSGWDAVAQDFMKYRSDSGSTIVKEWCSRLAENPSILDIGCGHGLPLTPILLGANASIFAIDSSQNMVSAYRENFPEHPIAYEAAEDSRFFDRKFDGIMAIGLIFLLPEDRQKQLLEKMSRHLKPYGHILFSAPHQICEWKDIQTGRRSVSLGSDAYRDYLERLGLRIIGDGIDKGESYYLMAQKSR